MNTPSTASRKIYVQGMTSDCCVRLLHYIFIEEGVEGVSISKGFIEISEDHNIHIILPILRKNGFPPIDNKEKILVEKIKQSIHELIFLSNNNNSIIRNSDYLVEKLEFSYPKLARVFSEQEDRTIERYIIEQKIERTKYLIDLGQMSLSEIAFQMGYSSTQYLSTQFKQISGKSISEYKNIK